jgi:hypothetical protein
MWNVSIKARRSLDCGLSESWPPESFFSDSKPSLVPLRPYSARSDFKTTCNINLCYIRQSDYDFATESVAIR